MFFYQPVYSFPTHQIQGFNTHGEEHGEVNVAFWNVNLETFQHQGEADQYQERERQHFD